MDLYEKSYVLDILLLKIFFYNLKPAFYQANQEPNHQYCKFKKKPKIYHQIKFIICILLIYFSNVSNKRSLTILFAKFN